jgi:hypothetical protein
MGRRRAPSPPIPSHNLGGEGRELGTYRGIISCLEGLAGAAAMEGQRERAAQLLGAVEALRKAGGPVRETDDCADEKRLMGDANAGFGRAAWAAGRAMSMEEAVCVALEESEIPTTGRQGS